MGSGDYDENGEYGEYSETSQQWPKITGGLAKILITLQERLLAKKKCWRNGESDKNGDFECNVNKIGWVIPDWNIIKDYHWLLPHLENYLFSPTFSLTLNTLKNPTPQNLVYACPTRFVSFQQPDIKSNMVHVCFVLKTYIPLCKIWGLEYLQNVILYQSHLPFTSKVKQQYCPTLYKSIIITFHAMNPWLMVSICYCNIKWHILLFSVAKTFIFYYIQLPGGGGTGMIEGSFWVWNFRFRDNIYTISWPISALWVFLLRLTF